MPRTAPRPQGPPLELDQVLSMPRLGSPQSDAAADALLRAFFAHGEAFPDEYWLVRCIERHLLTPTEAALLAAHGLSVPDLLNCRYGDAEDAAVRTVYGAWNRLLGRDQFGT